MPDTLGLCFDSVGTHISEILSPKASAILNHPFGFS